MRKEKRKIKSTKERKTMRKKEKEKRKRKPDVTHYVVGGRTLSESKSKQAEGESAPGNNKTSARNGPKLKVGRIKHSKITGVRGESVDGLGPTGRLGCFP